MAVYGVFFSNLGVPQTGLTPVWDSLFDLATSVAIPSGEYPVINEIGDGWYQFFATPADPWVGILDGGVSLANADRYKPIYIQTSAETAFGSVQVTIALTDALTTNPIPDVEIIIFNQNQSLIVNSALSNSMGILVAQLNPGQYVVTFRKDGYNLPTPQTITVSTSTTFSFQGTNVGQVAANFQTIVAPFNPSNFPQP